MKKIPIAKRLRLNRETLLSLSQLSTAVGGSLVVPSKPNASCFKACPPTENCPITQGCGVLSENC